MESRQQSWPRAWLMTDERLGDRLWDAVARVPVGGGIVFRHYSLSKDQRSEMGKRIAEIARQRGIVLAVAADEVLAEQLGADLVHNPTRTPGRLQFSRSVHNPEEAAAARLAGASLVFVSPVHATRSHRGAAALGIQQALRIAQAAALPAIALGGMDAERFAPLERDGFYGWAGIDAWLSVRT